MPNPMQIFGVTLASILCVALALISCRDQSVRMDHPTRTIQGPAGATLDVPHPMHGLVPANGAVLDFVAEFVGPESVVALPADSLKYSNLPASVRDDWSARPTLTNLSLEELISSHVAFVIAHDWQVSKLSKAIGSGAVGVMYLPEIKRFEDLVESIHWVGAALDQPTRSKELVEALQAIRAEMQAKAGPLTGKTAMVYSNYGSGSVTSGSGTSYDVMIGMTGLSNAAADAGIQGSRDISIEGLLSIQPDFLILSGDADGNSPSLDSLKDTLKDVPLDALRDNRILLLEANQLVTTSHHIVYAAQALQDKALTRLAE